MRAFAVARWFFALVACLTPLAQAETQGPQASGILGRAWHGSRNLLFTVTKKLPSPSSRPPSGFQPITLSPLPPQPPSPSSSSRPPPSPLPPSQSKKPPAVGTRTSKPPPQLKPSLKPRSPPPKPPSRNSSTPAPPPSQRPSPLPLPPRFQSPPPPSKSAISSPKPPQSLLLTSPSRLPSSSVRPPTSAQPTRPPTPSTPPPQTPPPPTSSPPPSRPPSPSAPPPQRPPPTFSPPPPSSQSRASSPRPLPSPKMLVQLNSEDSENPTIVKNSLTDVTPPERGGCVDAADALADTNSYRAQHDAPAMTWDEDLAASSEAFAWELYRRGDCKTAHSTDFTYGENVYAEMKYPKQYSATCREAVDEWYYESLSFNFNTKQLFAVNAGKGLGHFTQLVWRSSTSMGCGVALADQPIVFPSGTVRSGGCKIVVCRYLPPGNVPTDKAYIENVLPPRR